jgi:crotonobetainyl-CoA:carnitine CoA-transferase CaiB-like acyl-CoA transferase
VSLAYDARMTAPLAGIKVVDFTEYIAGPYCTMMLADMGADVVKVERPEGDAWRHTAPVAPYESRGFIGVNRGKRSIALDLERPEGREIARKLALGADVVTIAYRPGVAKRLGLDYETLSRERSALIYAENSAFGHEGPYAGRPGFDILSQGATGMVLYENKIERGVPTFITTLAVADLTTGMFMAFAVVSALFERTVTGKGTRIETSLFASGLAAQYRPLLSVEDVDGPVREGFLEALSQRRKEGIRYDAAAKLRGEYIAARGRNNYYRIYETKDGLIAVACLNNRQRRAMRDVLGVEDATVDGMAYDWFSEEVRQAHKANVEALEERLRERTTGDWIAALDAADVPCGPVNFPEELFEHPHVEANALMQTLAHPVLGALRMPASPMRLDGTRPNSERPPPYLGQHGPEVLRETGYCDEEIDRLVAEGVVVTRERLVSEG